MPTQYNFDISNNYSFVFMDYYGSIPESICSTISIQPKNDELKIHNEQRYYESVWLTAHNAHANTEEGWLYAQQSMNLTNMFKSGVRAFMIDVYDYQDQLLLCHISCNPFSMLLQKPTSNPATFDSWLKNIHEILHQNPNEIITLILESHAPCNKVFYALNNSGLIQYILKDINPNNQSLTLNYMLETNQRLVIFSDYNFEIKQSSYYSSIKELSRDPLAGIYDGLFPSLNYKETQFKLEFYSADEMRLNDFRADPGDAQVRLFVLNHFGATSLWWKDFESINAYSYLMNRINLYQAKGLFPNFITVDYFEKGTHNGDISTKMVVSDLQSQLLERKLIDYKHNELHVNQKI